MFIMLKGYIYILLYSCIGVLVSFHLSDATLFVDVLRTEAAQAVCVPSDDTYLNFFLKQVLHLCFCDGFNIVVFYLGLCFDAAEFKGKHEPKMRETFHTINVVNQLRHVCCFDICLTRS